MSLSKSKKVTSTLWKYFIIINADLKSCRCELCGCVLSYRSTTNNLKKHLERRHVGVNLNYDSGLKEANNPRLPLPSTSGTQHQNGFRSSSITSVEIEEDSRSIRNTIELNVPAKKPKQTSIANFIPKKINATQKQQIDQAFLKLFYKDFQPFSIVEDTGFCEFVHFLNPSYEIPTRKTISQNLIPATYEKCRAVVLEAIKTVNKICLTVDSWTSSINEGYLAVTGHYITDDFVLNSVLLDCLLIEGSHTSEHLASEILKIINKYGISNKVQVIVTDNAANMVAAVKNELGIKHWPCYAHTLNIIVQDALKNVSALVDKCKLIVTHFKRSNLATEKLIKYQRNSNIQNPKKLLQDVSTRWNSTYYMLRRLVELQEAVRSSLALINKDLPTLSNEEWTICSELIKVLKPFEQVTSKMSGEKYFTGSQIVVLTNGLQNVCSKLMLQELNPSVKKVVIDLASGILTRFDNLEYNKLVGVNTFLDPRFKLFAFSSDKHKDYIKKHLIQLVTSKIDKQKQAQRNINIDHQHPSTVIRPESEEDISVFELFDSVIKQIDIGTQTTGTSTSNAIIEIDRYLAEPPLLRESDPFQWWKSHSIFYPNLSSLVKEYMNFIGTSVPCERLFSKTGIIINDRRTKLKSVKVTQLVYLNVNYEYLCTTQNK